MTAVEHHIDHFVLLAPALEQATEFFSELLGREPIRAPGVHLDAGTEHLLYSLGNRQYMEILCPVADPPHGSPGANIATLRHPVMSAFGVSTPDMQKSVAQLEAAGFAPDPVYNLTRPQRDGRQVHWKLCVVSKQSFDHLFPFLIDWCDLPHVSQSLTSHCRLHQFVAYHPEPERLRAAYKGLHLNAEVKQAETAYFEVVLDTPNGMISIRTGKSIKLG